MPNPAVSFNDVLSEKVKLESSTSYLQKFFLALALLLFFVFFTVKQAPAALFFQSLVILTFWYVVTNKHVGFETFLLFMVCMGARNLVTTPISYGLEGLLFIYSVFYRTIFLSMKSPPNFRMFLGAVGICFYSSFTLWSFYWVIGVFLLFFESPWTFNFSKLPSLLLNTLRIIFVLASFFFLKRVQEPQYFSRMVNGFHFAILLLTLVYSYRVSRPQWFYLSIVTLFFSVVFPLEAPILICLSLPIFISVLKEEVPLLFKRESLKQWNQEHNGRLLFVVFYCLLLRSAIRFYKI